MIYVFDTNILVHLIRQTPGIQALLSAIGVFKPKNHIVISIVSAAEIRSF